MQAIRTVQTPDKPEPQISEHARYLLQVLEKLRAKPGTLARKIDLPVSTLTRHVPDRHGRPKPNTPRTMHSEVLAKLEQISGIPAPQSIRPGSRPALQAIAGFASDAAPYDAEKRPGSGLEMAVRALVGTKPAANPWTMQTRALERAGYLQGDIVIIDLGRPPQDHDAVCAQVYNWERPRETETVMRIYREIGGVKMLLPASNHPSFQDPIVVNERVSVKGVIIASIRVKNAG